MRVRRNHLLALPVLALAAGSVGCNPLIYDKLLEDVYVSSFRLRSPTGAPVHNPIALTFGPDENGKGHVLMASPSDATMVWLGLSAGADPVEVYPTIEDLQALIFPLEGVQKVTIGGFAKVPSPVPGDPTPHVVAAYKHVGDLANSRVVRFDIPDFLRTDDNELDIANPEIGGSAVPDFGSGIAAINLDGAQDQPDYEVAVGSDEGVLVFDSVGANLETYMAEKASMGAACTGANEPNCFHFTLCDSLGLPTGMSQGRFMDGDGPAIVVATELGLTFITDKATPEQNAVGAPVYDCGGMVWSAPSGSSPTYGKYLFVDDINGDGHDDLIVGDPGANRAHVHLGSGSGLSKTAFVTLEPAIEEEALEFGFSIGRADLGPTIGSVLLVGAPGSTVDGKPEVGKVFVYDLDDLATEPITVLADTTPEKNSRFGIWVGGIRIDADQDELVISGRQEAKVHVAINELDPYAG
jgi:hypothetical protein